MTSEDSLAERWAIMRALDAARFQTGGIVVDDRMLINSVIAQAIVLYANDIPDPRSRTRRAMPRDLPAFFTCQQCGRTSYHLAYIAANYCGHCHVFNA